MRITGASALIVVALALIVAPPGCGVPAKAEPLEVTYYYLPG